MNKTKSVYLEFIIPVLVNTAESNETSALQYIKDTFGPTSASKIELEIQKAYY